MERFKRILMYYLFEIKGKIGKLFKKTYYIFHVLLEKNLVEKKIFLLQKREKSVYYFTKNNVWPFFLSSTISLILLKVVFYLHQESFFASHFVTIFLVIMLVVSFFGWFNNLNNESSFESEHSIYEKKNLVQGFLLFILIEFMTFAACFWVFFHSGLAPSIWIGAFWPGEGIVSILVSEDVTLYKYYDRTAHFYDVEPCTISYNSKGLSSTDYFSNDYAFYPDRFRIHINLVDKGQLINPYKVPLMNTFILLTSAATITISHKSLKLKKHTASCIFLFLTIVLGIIFVKIQYLEYINSMVSSHDGIYGSSFFAITGLHGFHVILGILFLFFCLLNIIFGNYYNNMHRSFEFAIWYWHFVDVIWIFVYFLLYLWPASFFYKEEIFIWTISYNYFCVNINLDDYKNILFLNYLQALKNKDKNLFWIGESLQNYNTNLIRRDVEHYHFFLEMTREYILFKVLLHQHLEKVKYESVYVFLLLLYYTIISEIDLILFVFFSVIIWFKTDRFDFIPYFIKLYYFLFELFVTRKNDKKSFLLEVWKNRQNTFVLNDSNIFVIIFKFFYKYRHWFGPK